MILDYPYGIDLNIKFYIGRTHDFLINVLYLYEWQDRGFPWFSYIPEISNFHYISLMCNIALHVFREETHVECFIPGCNRRGDRFDSHNLGR